MSDMTSTYMFYILAFVAVMVAVIVMKKVTGCFIKSVVLLLLLSATALYYFYFRE